GKSPSSYLGELDPSNPNLEQLWKILDAEYLSGVNVEDAIRREVERIAKIDTDSPVQRWINLLNTVRQLCRRVNAGTLSTSSERTLYHLLLSKLPPDDRKVAA